MAVFIKLGDAPLSVRQATKRGLQIVEQELFLAGARPGDRDILAAMPHEDLPERLAAVVAALGHASYSDYASAWEADNLVNGANNLANHQLAAYRAARARLFRYRLADGQTEVVEDRPTGAVDPETGNPIMAAVVIRSAVDPLPATINQPIINPETGAQIGTETVPNPLIVADDAERAAAQGVIDGTPAEIVAFSGSAGR